jgi:arginyl-tRNA synthetase
MRNAADEGISTEGLSVADLTPLVHDEELKLIKQLSLWPRIVEAAAEAHEPHRIATYLYELASAFHSLWNMGRDDPSLRFLVAGEEGLTRARLALIEGVRQVIAAGLGIFGVEPVEEMR